MDSTSASAEQALCQQCRLMFSEQGFKQLFSSAGFFHSTLDTFENRQNCRLCCYVWSENIIGDSSQSHNVRALRDLVISTSTYNFAGRNAVQAARSLVFFRAVGTSSKEWEGLALRVESSKRRMQWEPFNHLRVVVSAGIFSIHKPNIVSTY